MGSSLRAQSWSGCRKRGGASATPIPLRPVRRPGPNTVCRASWPMRCMTARRRSSLLRRLHPAGAGPGIPLARWRSAATAVCRPTRPTLRRRTTSSTFWSPPDAGAGGSGSRGGGAAGRRGDSPPTGNRRAGVTKGRIQNANIRRCTRMHADGSVPPARPLSPGHSLYWRWRAAVLRSHRRAFACIGVHLRSMLSFSPASPYDRPSRKSTL